MVTERPAPSLNTQALEGMFCLQALGIVGTRFLVTEVHLSLTACSCVARGAETAGTLRAILAGCSVPTGTVCTAGTDVYLTTWSLEA